MTGTRFFVVDGSGYIFRAFYATPHLSNQAGLPTNAVYGFTRMLLKLLNDERPEYLVVTFDTGKPNFRHQIYPAYKANRAACPEELKVQMPYFRSVVEALGICSLEVEGFEADDIIATLVSDFSDQVDKMVVVSGDKDLTQLVTERVEIWDAMRDIHFTPEVVKDKFGVLPHRMKDYLALAGDSSDNIPGAKGIGAKTAQQLVNSYDSLGAMFADPALGETMQGVVRGASAVQKKLAESRIDVEISQQLVMLAHDVPLPLNSEKLDNYVFTGLRHEQVHNLFEELDFLSLLDSLSPDLVRRRKEILKKKLFSTVKKGELASVVNRIFASGRFAFDTETTSLSVVDCDLVGLSLCCASGMAWYIPVGGIGCASKDEYCSLEEIINELRVVFEDELLIKIGFNLKFDVGVLAQNGVIVRGPCLDAMLASYVLSPDRRQHSLSVLTKENLLEEMQSYKELVGDKVSIADVPVSLVSDYACHDAEASWNLMEIFSRKLSDLDVQAQADSHGDQDKDQLIKSPRFVFERIEMPLVPILSRMERTGVKVDSSFLLKLQEEFQESLQLLASEIRTLAGCDFNLNSPKQLSEVLFDRLGLPTKGIRRTKTNFSTDADVLSKLAHKYEIAAKLLEYREVHKLITTYVEGLVRLINPKTGRIHGSFNQSVAATGRLSSSEPNLQNIPIRTPRGKMIRKAFIPEDGFVLISADYSQIELRVLAHLSGDPTLRNAFLSGEDIHKKTAIEMFGPLASGGQEEEMRRLAKTINFGVIYGISAFRLSEQLGIGRREAQDFIDRYFSRYPKVKEYFSALERQFQEKGYVSTLFGRRRYGSEIDVSGRDAGYTLRSLLNFPIQGTAADIMKLAMIDLDRKIQDFGDDARTVLQVHDELVFEVKENAIGPVSELVKDGMREAVQLSVPLEVDLEVLPTWGG